MRYQNKISGPTYWTSQRGRAEAFWWGDCKLSMVAPKIEQMQRFTEALWNECYLTCVHLHIYIYVYSYKPRVTGRVTGVFESHYCLGTSPAGLQNRFPNLILLFLLMSSANRFAKPINQLTMSAECTRRVQADQDDWPVVIHSLNRYSYAYKYWYIWFYILQ